MVGRCRVWAGTIVQCIASPLEYHSEGGPVGLGSRPGIQYELEGPWQMVVQALPEGRCTKARRMGLVPTISSDADAFRSDLANLRRNTNPSWFVEIAVVVGGGNRRVGLMGEAVYPVDGAISCAVSSRQE